MKASPLGKGETIWKMPSCVNFYLIVMAGKLFLMSIFKEHRYKHGVNLGVNISVNLGLNIGVHMV